MCQNHPNPFRNVTFTPAKREKTAAQLWADRLKREAQRDSRAMWYCYGMLAGLAIAIAYAKGYFAPWLAP